jgi:hypothetical protein
LIIYPTANALVYTSVWDSKNARYGNDQKTDNNNGRYSPTVHMIVGVVVLIVVII